MGRGVDDISVTESLIRFRRMRALSLHARDSHVDHLALSSFDQSKRWSGTAATEPLDPANMFMSVKAALTEEENMPSWSRSATVPPTTLVLPEHLETLSRRLENPSTMPERVCILVAEGRSPPSRGRERGSIGSSSLFRSRGPRKLQQLLQPCPWSSFALVQFGNPMHSSRWAMETSTRDRSFFPPSSVAFAHRKTRDSLSPA